MLPHTLSANALDFAQTLVRMNTVSDNSNLELIHFIRDHLARLGVESRLTYNANKTKANTNASAETCTVLGPASKRRLVNTTELNPWEKPCPGLYRDSGGASIAQAGDVQEFTRL